MKNIYFFTCLFYLLSYNSIGQQLKLGKNFTVINSDALLELESSNRGLLLPRVSLDSTNNAAPLQNHVAGMIVYNSSGGTLTEGFYFNDGTKWNRVSISDLYSSNGSLSSSRKVNLNNFNLIFEGVGNIGVGVNSDPNYKLHVNGSIASTSGYYNLSDYRFKKDIMPLSNSLNKLMKVQGVSYFWNQKIDSTKKLDSKPHLGFIAQDIEQIFPEIVTVGSDPLNTKSVAYADLIPVLVEAIKELKIENNNLHTQLELQNILFEKKLKEQFEELKSILEKSTKSK